MLHKSGLNVLVLEGAERIGGRIQSLLDPVNGRALADLGPTWVWPTYQPAVAWWLNELRISSFPQYADGDGIVEGWSAVPERYPLPVQDGIRRIVGGPGALVSALAAILPSAAIRTNAEVVEVGEQGASSVRVVLDDGSELTAHHVVIAAPLRIAATKVSIPDLDAATRHIMMGTPTWMSTQAKAVALYDRPFWRDEGLSGRIASRQGPLTEAHDHTPHGEHVGAIFGFIGWTPEERRRGADGLRSAIRDQLTRCFGPRAAHPTELIIEDWAQNTRICDSSILPLSGAHPEIVPDTLRTAHLNGKLWFAVSETSATSPGLIEGALEAGARVGREIGTSKDAK